MFYADVQSVRSINITIIFLLVFLTEDNNYPCYKYPAKTYRREF
jgi:hypothetical protein